MSDMDLQELRDILGRIGWSQGELARRANRHERGIRKMAQGIATIDAPLAKWLRELDVAHAAFDRVLDRPPPNPMREAATHADTPADPWASSRAAD